MKTLNNINSNNFSKNLYIYFHSIIFSVTNISYITKNVSVILEMNKYVWCLCKKLVLFIFFIIKPLEEKTIFQKIVS